MFENATNFEDVAIFGIEPLQQIIDLIEMYADDSKKVTSLAIVAGGMLSDLYKCTYRLIDTPETGT